MYYSFSACQQRRFITAKNVKPPCSQRSMNAYNYTTVFYNLHMMINLYMAFSVEAGQYKTTEFYLISSKKM